MSDVEGAARQPTSLASHHTKNTPMKQRVAALARAAPGVIRTPTFVQSALPADGRSERLCRMDVEDTRARLIRLQAERFAAVELGAESPSPYVDRLDAAIEDARTAYVTSAVLEIALLRESLAGAAQG